MFIFTQIDVLVNNAGRSQRALWMNTTFGVDREMLEVNTLGPLSLTKAILPHMVARKSGHIAVVSSIVGLMGKSCSLAHQSTVGRCL